MNMEQQFYNYLASLPVATGAETDEELADLSATLFRAYAMSTAYQLVDRLNTMQPEERFFVDYQHGAGATFYVVRSRAKH
jgi:hypothetical protein